MSSPGLLSSLWVLLTAHHTRSVCDTSRQRLGLNLLVSDGRIISGISGAGMVALTAIITTQYVISIPLLGSPSLN